MNNWIKRLCTAAFFPAALTCILLALWLFPPAVPVDNITPAEDIISREYSLERLLLTKAIFDVRHGFEEVTAQQLARETGVLLADYRAAILLCCGRVRLSMLSLR